MGNEITSIAPSQIQPIESYFAGEDRVTGVESLSSTRFFKTVRGTYKGGGEVVTKVLAKYDIPLQLEKQYEQTLNELKQKLSVIPNALAYVEFWETEKAAYLLRQHVRYNLYDRLSTRPLLSNIEKKWIAFQLLRALDDGWYRKVSHGDIKSENVLLTGWNWAFLTDYAPFKPTELPLDDPGDYDFYYDTARRRTTYIAPERFIDPSERLPNPNAKLDPGMDIFSLGCVIAEMFSDGRQVFDLSELLEYKRGHTPDMPFKSIRDDDVRALLKMMLQLDPSQRAAASVCLTARTFPNYFQDFLHMYMKNFTYGVDGEFVNPDQRIQNIKTKLNTILRAIAPHTEQSDRESGYGDGLVIVLSAVTSQVRALQLTSSKMQVLEMMRIIAQHIRDEFILDRIIPFVMCLVNDTMTTVRAEAIRTLSFCLAMVRKIPKSDVNLFQDYILPGLSTIPEDIEVTVRIALAECIADLAESSHRFLEIGLHDASQTADDDYEILGSYDSELSILRTQVARAVSSLLSDQDNTVKKTLMRSLKKLCHFFGFQQANDVLLGHTITYLNDKGDWQLHKVFFECIVDLVAFLGWPAVCLVEPLLLQGLCDPEESVISTVIDAITSMCGKKLFNLPKLLEFVDHVVPFLLHPNIWIRYAAVGFVSKTACELGEIDSACFLEPKLEPFLTKPLMDFTNSLLLLSVVKPPLLRNIYDSVLKTGRKVDLREFFDILSERQSVRNLTRPGYDVMYPSVPAKYGQVLHKLQTLKMDAKQEDALLDLHHVAMKIYNSRLFVSDTQVTGVVDLDTCGVQGNCVSLSTVEEQWFKEPNEMAVPVSVPVDNKLKTQQVGSMNEDFDEWNLMFSDSPSKKNRTHSVMGRSGAAGSVPPRRTLSTIPSRKLSKIPDGIAALDIEHNLPSVDLRSGRKSISSKKSRHKRSKSDTSATSFGRELFTMEGRVTQVVQLESSCSEDLEIMMQRKIRTYSEIQRAKEDCRPRIESFFNIPEWHGESSPQANTIKLVSHLQEHKSAINKIRINKDESLFATFSNDSTFKLWPATKLDGQPFILKAKHSQKLDGKVKSGVFCNNSQNIAAATTEGIVQMFSIAKKSSIYNFKELDLNKDDYVVDMNCVDTLSAQNIICCATSLGKLHGFDIRTKKPIWELKQSYDKGLLTAMTVDPHQCWVATGTSRGYHLIWDMRFHLPIKIWQYTDGNLVGPVYSMSPHPRLPHILMAAEEGNNEVTMWNMETGMKKQMLWGVSQAPPFQRSTKDCQHTSVRAICSGFIKTEPFVFTGGSDRKVRLWNLCHPEQSTLLVMPNGSPDRDTIFRHQVIEGIAVIAEAQSPRVLGNKSAPSELPRGVPHIDMIDDLVVIKRGQYPYLISGAHNGELKIWR